MNRIRFFAGLSFTVIAALIILLPLPQLYSGIAIAIGVLGIGLIATARRRG